MQDPSSDTNFNTQGVPAARRGVVKGESALTYVGRMTRLLLGRSLGVPELIDAAKRSGLIDDKLGPVDSTNEMSRIVSRYNRDPNEFSVVLDQGSGVPLFSLVRREPLKRDNSVIDGYGGSQLHPGRVVRIM